MAPVRLVTHRQMELIIEFAERNRYTLSDRKSLRPHGSAAKAWEDLTRKLNSIGEGCKKNPEQWKRYWHTLKCRTKAKAADMRRRVGPLGPLGPDRLPPLTDLEQRVVRAYQKEAPKDISEIENPVENNSDEAAETSEPSAADNVIQEITVNTCKLETESADEYEASSPEACDESRLEDQTDPLKATVPLRVTASRQDADSLTDAISVPTIVPSARGTRYRMTFPVRGSVNRPIPARHPASTSTPLRGPASRPNSGRDSTSRPSISLQTSKNDFTGLKQVYKLEERRIAAEERLAEAVAGMSSTNEGILRCLQQMAASQAQLAYLLQRHLNKPSEK